MNARRRLELAQRRAERVLPRGAVIDGVGIAHIEGGDGDPVSWVARASYLPMSGKPSQNSQVDGIGPTPEAAMAALETTLRDMGRRARKNVKRNRKEARMWP